MKHKIIETKLYNASQSWCFTRFVDLANGKKVVIEIRRNAYDEQSYARVKVWREEHMDWSHVYSIHHTSMNCMHLSYVWDKERVSEEDFQKDFEILLKQAERFLK